MIFGNLNEVLENEKNIYSVIQESVDNSKQEKKTKFSKLLIKLSKYGMDYYDDIIKNMRAVPADKLLQDKDDPLLQQTLFSHQMNNWKVKPEEEKSFAEKSLDVKRETLRKLAMAPELEDILDVMANECIVYDDENAYIAQPFLDTALIQELNEKSADEIKAAVNTAFYKLYALLGFKKNAWDVFKRFLIDGILCYQIIYDDMENPKTIIGIVDVDPNTLTKTIKDGITIWCQFKGIPGRERYLLDSEIIYIKYEDTGVSSRQSYLERLIRPYNIYRIVEQAQVIWTVTQASFKTIFTIPVAGMSRTKGLQTLTAAMNRYQEDISFNTETGELTINGKKNQPFNKEYWMPENENGTPQIEQLVDNGPQLNDSDQLKYFEQKLFKMSKIPSSRFDSEAQQTWFGSDPTQQLRDEINFSRFVTRIRNTFSEILLKPLRIQLSLTIPDIKDDKRILDAISLHFNSYNEFEEMMNIELTTKRIEFISTFRDSLVIQDGDDEKPYFNIRFLVEKYLKMSEADLELNQKYNKEDELAKKSKDKEGDDEGGDDEGGDDEGGDDGGGELDDDMLGDVEPESSETTQL